MLSSFWDHVGSMLGPCGVHVGVLGSSWEALGKLLGSFLGPQNELELIAFYCFEFGETIFISTTKKVGHFEPVLASKNVNESESLYFFKKLCL